MIWGKVQIHNVQHIHGKRSWAKVSWCGDYQNSALPVRSRTSKASNWKLTVSYTTVQFHISHQSTSLLPTLLPHNTEPSQPRLPCLLRSLEESCYVHVTFFILTWHPVNQQRGSSVVEDYENSLSSPTIPFNLTHPPTQFLESCVLCRRGVTNLPLCLGSPTHTAFHWTLKCKVELESVWMKSHQKVLHLLFHDLPFPYHIEHLKPL